MIAPERAGRVDVDARPEELADAGLVALFRGVGECGARRRDGWGGEADPQEYESTYFSPVHARLLCDVNSLEEVFDFSGAVHERIQMNANAIEQREVEVGQVRSLLVPNVPAAL